MRVPTTRWPKTPHRLVVGALAVCLISLPGCGAAQDPVLPSPSPASPASPAKPAKPASPASPSVPADGVTLSGLGFSHGPLDTFSLPRALTISTRVDQPNAVTVVMTAPSLMAVADYLRRALPVGGYVITAQDPAGTMTFAGQGWTGYLTGDDGVTAVTLSPLT